MSKILLDLKKRLTNSIELSTLITEVARLRETAKENTAPLVKQFADSYDGKYQTSEVKYIGGNLNRFSRSIRSTHFLASIYDALEVASREAETLLEKLGEEKIHAIMAESLDTKHALALQFVNIAEFLTETARVTMIVVAEFENSKLSGKDTDSSMQKYFENNFTEANLNAFAQIITYFASRKRDDVITDIYDLPSIKVDEGVLQTIMSTEGTKGMDPSGLTVLGIFHLINPIFYIWASQKVWSELKLKWLSLIEDELTYLEIRHQELLELRDKGDSTMGTQKKIERYRDEIDVKRAQVKRIRRKLGDGDD